MPGSPSFSWPMFRQRLRAYSDTVDWNVAIAFWLFGMSSQLPPATRLSNTWHRHFQRATP
jgi:hypothetical protein